MTQQKLIFPWFFFQKVDRKSTVQHKNEKKTETRKKITPTSEKNTQLFCARCGILISDQHHLFSYDGQRKYRVFVNPIGAVFEVCTLVQATNLIHIGELSTEATWFEGHSWQICICSGCHAHLGK